MALSYSSNRRRNGYKYTQILISKHQLQATWKTGIYVKIIIMYLRREIGCE
jgi:hypothetical protein